jgi:hypothetical protein
MRHALLVLPLVILSACKGAGGHEPLPAPPVQAPALAHPAPPAPPPPAPAPPAPAPATTAALAPKEPSYDLALDREERVRAARAALGPRAVTAVAAEVFVMVGAPDWQGPSFRRSVTLVESAMAAFANGRFAKTPDRAITVYLFATGAAYEAFCRAAYDAPCIAHYGFYSPSDRAMVMNAGLGLGTLTHELVHPLVEADFPGAPTWLNEGIASVFEAPVIPRPGEIHGVKNWRHPRLLRALTSAEQSRARLDGLFGMSDETFRGEGEDLNYAVARYVCHWLDTRGKLWPFYQRWRDTFRDDPSGEVAFADVVGMTPRAAHAAWASWVRAL